MNKKGKKIMKSMSKTYGAKKAKQVFYASKNAGKIKGVEGKKKKNPLLSAAGAKGYAKKKLTSIMRSR